MPEHATDMARDSWFLPESELHSVGVAILPVDVAYVAERPVLTFELTWLSLGDATAILNGERLELPWRSVILNRPGDRVAYEYHGARTRTRTYHSYVTFRIPRFTPPVDWPRTRQLREGDFLLTLFDHILWLDSERPDGWRASVLEATRYATRIFLAGTSGTKPTDGQALPEIVMRALAPFISAQNDGSGLPTPTLPELAAAARVSKEYLCRVFARDVGLSPVSTIRLLRLKRACALLLYTSLTVGEISRLTGFVNEFHFSRTFAKHLRVSPVRFRRGDPARGDLPLVIHRLDAALAR
jgi:AraC-like DNA-binding protein